jgi:hypothetical protein
MPYGASALMTAWDNPTVSRQTCAVCLLISLTSADVTGGDVTTADQRDAAVLIPSASVVKWVRSRSLPAIR